MGRITLQCSTSCPHTTNPHPTHRRRTTCGFETRLRTNGTGSPLWQGMWCLGHCDKGTGHRPQYPSMILNLYIKLVYVYEGPSSHYFRRIPLCSAGMLTGEPLLDEDVSQPTGLPSRPCASHFARDHAGRARGWAKGWFPLEKQCRWISFCPTYWKIIERMKIGDPPLFYRADFVWNHN